MLRGTAFDNARYVLTQKAWRKAFCRKWVNAGWTVSSQGMAAMDFEDLHHVYPPQYPQAFLQCFSLLDQSTAVSLETYLYSRQLQLGAVKISICACAAGQTSRGQGSAHRRIWWTETYSQQGVWSAGGGKGKKKAQRWSRDTCTDAKSKCGSKTSTQQWQGTAACNSPSNKILSKAAYKALEWLLI